MNYNRQGKSISIIMTWTTAGFLPMKHKPYFTWNDKPLWHLALVLNVNVYNQHLRPGSNDFAVFMGVFRLWWKHNTWVDMPIPPHCTCKPLNRDNKESRGLNPKQLPSSALETTTCVRLMSSGCGLMRIVICYFLLSPVFLASLWHGNVTQHSNYRRNMST